MATTPALGAAPFVPATRTLPVLRNAIQSCHGCDLYRHATQAGAVAAQSLLGSKFRITESHGQLQQPQGLPPVIATLHPSAILRSHRRRPPPPESYARRRPQRGRPHISQIDT